MIKESDSEPEPVKIDETLLPLLKQLASLFVERIDPESKKFRLIDLMKFAEEQGITLRNDYANRAALVPLKEGEQDISMEIEHEQFQEYQLSHSRRITYLGNLWIPRELLGVLGFDFRDVEHGVLDNRNARIVEANVDLRTEEKTQIDETLKTILARISSSYIGRIFERSTIFDFLDLGEISRELELPKNGTYDGERVLVALSHPEVQGKTAYELPNDIFQTECFGQFVPCLEHTEILALPETLEKAGLTQKERTHHLTTKDMRVVSFPSDYQAD